MKSNEQPESWKNYQGYYQSYQVNEQVQEVFNLLLEISSISRKTDERRLILLAKLLVEQYRYSFDYIMKCALRYAESISSGFREIQLSDFTNPSALSEKMINDMLKDVEMREKEVKKKMEEIDKIVEQRVQEKLEQIQIELSAIGEKYANQKVVASQATYIALRLLEEEKKKKIEELVPEMKRRLDDAYKEIIAKI